MSLFKPSEIRIILILSILALIGSAFTLLKRQGKISNFEISALEKSSHYNYSYNSANFDRNLKSKKAGSKDQNIKNSAKKSNNPYPLNINKVGFYDLQILPGIGPALAREVVALRDSVGIFRSKEDLLKIKGIGPKKFNDIKDLIVLE